MPDHSNLDSLVEKTCGMLHALGESDKVDIAQVREVVTNEYREQVRNSGCGTGAGGFKPGNTCAKEDGSSSSSKPSLKSRRHLPSPSDRQALTKAVDDNPLDVLNWQAMADYHEEQGDEELATRYRSIASAVKTLMPLMDRYVEAAVEEHRTYRHFMNLRAMDSPEEEREAARVAWEAARDRSTSRANRVTEREAVLFANLEEDYARVSRALDKYETEAIARLGSRRPTGNADCGTGAGGFKPGNTCAKEDGSPRSSRSSGSTRRHLPSSGPSVKQVTYQTARAMTRAVVASQQAAEYNRTIYPRFGLQDPQQFDLAAASLTDDADASGDPLDLLDAADALEAASDAHRRARNWHEIEWQSGIQGEEQEYHDTQIRNRSSAVATYRQASKWYRKLAIARAQESGTLDDEFRLRVALSEDPQDQLTRTALADLYEERGEEKKATRYRPTGNRRRYIQNKDKVDSGDNCGTGAGGFQPGNTCARESPGSSSPSTKSSSPRSPRSRRHLPSGGPSVRQATQQATDSFDAARHLFYEVARAVGSNSYTTGTDTPQVDPMPRWGALHRILSGGNESPITTLDVADALDAVADAYEANETFYTEQAGLYEQQMYAAVPDWVHAIAMEGYTAQSHLANLLSRGREAFRQAARGYRRLAVARAQESGTFDDEFRLRVAFSDDPSDNLTRAALADLYEERGDERKARRYRPTGNKRKSSVRNSHPSDRLKMSPEKACKILKDKKVHGKPLTPKQRGMFGALCGKRGKATTNRKRTPTMNGRRGGGWEPVENASRESYFGTCERDDKGRCLPSGDSTGEVTGAGLGFAVGGLPGMLVGGVAGHLYDRGKESERKKPADVDKLSDKELEEELSHLRKSEGQLDKDAEDIDKEHAAKPWYKKLMASRSSNPNYRKHKLSQIKSQVAKQREMLEAEMKKRKSTTKNSLSTNCGCEECAAREALAEDDEMSSLYDDGWWWEVEEYEDEDWEDVETLEDFNLEDEGDEDAEKEEWEELDEEEEYPEED